MSRFFRSRWGIIALVVVVAGAIAAVSLTTGAAAETTAVTARVTRGDFQVNVTVAGDLRAKNSLQITPPANGCMVGACNMKIASIIAEGTVVKKGDTVAELDRSPLVTQTNNTNLALQKAKAVAEQAELDTTLNLSKAREDLRIARIALEERTIAKEQAQYEAPSIRRQAEIDYQKAERALKQGEVDYATRENQAKAKMREVSTDLQRNQNQITMIKDVTSSFTILAPSDGMLIYTRTYDGKKRGAGSMVWSGEGAIAELPDLLHMVSTTYVNEVDIRKVQVGQKVVLTLDSDPSKHLTGKIVAVANVGEERPNSDAKVFEVKIEVAESDTTLRPGMTTSNAIEVMSLKNVLSVPLEAITTEGTTNYVYKKDGSKITRQEVETGAINDMRVVINQGLSENDVVLLMPPTDHAGIETVALPAGSRTAPSGSDASPAKSVPVDPKKAAAPDPKAAKTTPPTKSGGKQ